MQASLGDCTTGAFDVNLYFLKYVLLRGSKSTASIYAWWRKQLFSTLDAFFSNIGRATAMVLSRTSVFASI